MKQLPVANAVRIFAIELILAVIASITLSPQIQGIADHFNNKPRSWQNATHFHSEIDSLHLAVAHESNEGHWIIVQCSLPQQVLSVAVRLEEQVSISSQLRSQGVMVSHQVDGGERISDTWTFRSSESQIFAADPFLAQDIVWSERFYFSGRFENPGPEYIATFDFTFDESAHPAIPVLVACDAPIIPGSQIVMYVVQPGDTLRGIAELFRVSIDDLITLNGLRYPMDLMVGQELRVMIRPSP